MKNLAHLFTLIFFFYLNPVQAIPIVPKNLHGFWSYKVAKVGNWNGTLIGDNYVEYNYRMYKVDSVKNTDGITKIWLNTKSKDPLTLEIKAPADGKALLKFNRWEKEISCTWNASDPDIRVYSKDEIPSYYFGKWVSLPYHSNFYITAKHKMLYQNKEWEIVWAGNYMDKEDRFLLKDKDSCRMVYIHKLVKALKVNSLEGLKIYTPIAKNPLVYQFLGNWINDETNAWQYGFFEDFAIYNQKVYPYKSIEKNGKSLKITLLIKDNKEKNIQFTAKNDSIAQLVDEQGTSNVYLLKKEFKSIRTKDTVAFKDSHFARVDTAVITGYLRNPTSNKPFSVGFTDHLKDEQVNYYGDLDSNGFFTVKVPLLNTTQVFLDWERNGVIDVIEPGEHYFYFEDFNTQLRSAMGDNAGFHNELLNYKYYGPYSRITEREYNARRNADLLSFLAISKNEHQKAIEYLNKHLAKYQNASNRFKYFVSEGYKYKMGFDLMQKRFTLNQEKFPEPFISFVSDSLYKNNPPKPFTLVRDFSMFKRDYFAYLASNERNSVKWDDVLAEMIYLKQIHLSGKEKEAMLAEIELNKIGSTKDSLKYIGLLKDFSPEKRKLADSVRRVYKQQIIDRADQKLAFNSFDKELRVAKGIENEDLSAGLIARGFYKYFEGKHTAMPDTVFARFIGDLKNDFYRNEIEKLQLSYQNMSKVDVEYKESLKRTDHLKDAKNADSLFAELIKPYKGKVIYVDFWGTWCAPCKGEMPFVKPVKEALKGKDVVFMYFANNSPEEGWKNIIKEYELSSENAVHYRLPETQQNMIETRFSINSFPTYILIDKEGNVNTMKAPRPSDKEQLVAAVNTLLTK